MESIAEGNTALKNEAPAAVQPVDVLRQYKQEFFELFGELLSHYISLTEQKLQDADLKALLDQASDRVMKARRQCMIHSTDTIFDWHIAHTSLMLLNRHVEELMDSSEIYEKKLEEMFNRTQVLALRADAISLKMQCVEMLA